MFVLVVLSLSTVLGLTVGSSIPETGRPKCSCARPEWCEPVEKKATKKEVFAFSVSNDWDHWSKYDWSKVTTIVQFGYVNASLACLAHSRNAKVIMLGGIHVKIMTSPALRKVWIQDQLNIVQNNYLDGINFDFEGVILKNQTDLRNAYTATVNETVQAFKAVSSHYQISVDLAWTPNQDDRYFDYRSLGQVADLLFVMAYDEQSQIYGECLALPNSGLIKTSVGLRIFDVNPDYHIPREKTILGVPWYGYIYPCINLTGDKCSIKKVPFRGVPCSDAAGRQYDYSYILRLLKTLSVQPQWNVSSSTPFLTYKQDRDSHSAYQIQYDNPHSLLIKYDLAEKSGYAGVGMWNIDSLDYSDTETGEAIRREMFGALP